MTNNMKFLTNILFSEDITRALEQVQSINSSEQLFILLDNYNWDNGFDLPQAVPELSKVQKFKLKKQHPDLLTIFLDGVDGEHVRVTL